MINIVKLLFLFLAGASTVYGFSVMPVKELKDGYIYIHTARNKPSITVGGKKIDAKEGMFVKAESAELKCAENQRIFFILSNRTVVQMDENSEIKIESFKQTMPFSSNFKDDYESTRSETVFSAGKGNFIFYTARLRATSVMKINSPYGSFDIQSREFELKISDTGAKISLIDGQSAFKALDGKTDFLKSKQSGTIIKSRSKERYPLKIEYIPAIEEEIMSDRFVHSKIVFNSILFGFDKDKNIKVERVVQKEFLTRRGRLDYRR